MVHVFLNADIVVVKLIAWLLVACLYWRDPYACFCTHLVQGCLDSLHGGCNILVLLLILKYYDSTPASSPHLPLQVFLPPAMLCGPTVAHYSSPRADGPSCFVLAAQTKTCRRKWDDTIWEAPWWLFGDAIAVISDTCNVLQHAGQLTWSYCFVSVPTGRRSMTREFLYPCPISSI